MRAARIEWEKLCIFATHFLYLMVEQSILQNDDTITIGYIIRTRALLNPQMFNLSSILCNELVKLVEQ